MTTRRSMLASAAGAAVYTLVPNPVAQAAQGGAPVRLGFIGVGIRGSYLLEEFSKQPGVTAVIAADLYDGHLTHVKELTGGKVALTKRHEDVLGRSDLDAIVIATPDHTHYRLTLDALASGRHVYVEKPMTWGFEEGPEIIAAEKKSGKVLMVGSHGKSTALVAKAREIVQSGALGAVRQLRMAQFRNTREGAWAYPVPSDASEKTVDWARFLGPRGKRPFSAEQFFRWRCWWDYSGGVATDLYVHFLTTIHEIMACGAPVSAVSLGGLMKHKDGRDVPDLMETLYEYPQGFFVQISVNLCGGGRGPVMTIHGEKGTLILEGGRITVVPEPEDLDIQEYAPAAWAQATREEYRKQRGADRPRPPMPEVKEYPVVEGKSHYEYFIESIRTGAPSRENATEGHIAAGAAHLANEAYRRGKRVYWDYNTNRVRS